MLGGVGIWGFLFIFRRLLFIRRSFSKLFVWFRIIVDGLSRFLICFEKEGSGCGVR